MPLKPEERPSVQKTTLHIFLPLRIRGRAAALCLLQRQSHAFLTRRGEIVAFVLPDFFFTWVQRPQSTGGRWGGEHRMVSGLVPQRSRTQTTSCKKRGCLYLYEAPLASLFIFQVIFDFSLSHTGHISVLFM